VYMAVNTAMYTARTRPWTQAVFTAVYVVV